ncbi:flagellar basal body-associated FliL family protein [Pseudodesulfovibrio thermohalotolerans]|jgi:flagellar FliL protein|uniref:flagellar basal body-associated FliL family protein n=1 Tax=Pseudodesulfovibrio thermohalotolerans TaxID=2880651 RepID=UPI0024420544|nr:flagellar basal body-associated FliL family protein [Pseudodesulfovibrio thermohalotolerans]WFS62147.1 flagellar basal body-associated FliL family protein [Pseudodesulfovibrio thermohalotolerans]
MAEDEIQEDGKKKKSGLLKWIIIVVLLAGLGVGGYFVYTMYIAAPDENATAQDDASGDPAQPAEQLEGQIVALPTFLVNLADPLGRRYLKLGVEVEVRDSDAQAALTKYEAKIKDTLLLLLSSKTYDGLSTMQAKVELKQEIADRLNQIIGNGGVLRVYITEMVIQ